VTYCLATPLAVFPSAYRAVLGLGQGKSSFYNKSVNSINTLIKFKGAFLLLASLAISASQCSPFRSMPVTMVSAPAFPDATSAPNVLDVSLPFRGSYLPHEIDSGGGIVHSYNSALLIDACSVANFSDPNTKGEISRAISTLPVAAGTVDSGASAHCTFRLQAARQHETVRRGPRRGQRSSGASHLDWQPPAHCSRRRWSVHTDAQYGRVLDCPRDDLRLWSFGMDRYPLDGRRRVRWYQCRRRAVSGMGENDVP
jgi:hypothetical protein